MKIIYKIGMGIVLLILDCLLIFVYGKEQIYLSNSFFVCVVILIDLLIILSLLLLEKNRKLQGAVETDLLTGGYSRHGFFRAANQLLTSSKRDIHNYVIVNLNIIDFKAINQKLGEKEADQILVQIYNAFSSYIKENCCNSF